MFNFVNVYIKKLNEIKEETNLLHLNEERKVGISEIENQLPFKDLSTNWIMRKN
jgi:hypothetical protein